MSMTMLPSGASTSRPAPAPQYRFVDHVDLAAPACSAESRTARISTLVEPDGIQITIRSEGRRDCPKS